MLRYLWSETHIAKDHNLAAFVRKGEPEMFDPLTLTLALNLTMLTAVYWVCLIVGGGLLVISTVSGADTNADVGGDFEADFDAELDADMDLETEIDHVEALHGGAMTLSTWFSIRFLVFAMAVFGALGVVLDRKSVV